MDVVTLKNGEKERKSLVNVTMMSLRTLMNEGKAMVVYELAELCRKPNHKPWGQTGEDLKKLQLATEQNGSWNVHDSIKNIILSAVEGEGLNMILGNPVQHSMSGQQETTLTNFNCTSRSGWIVGSWLSY